MALSFFDRERAKMTEATVPYDSDGIGIRIFTMREQKVILDVTAQVPTRSGWAPERTGTGQSHPYEA
jgi:hypothetical protein